MVSRVGREFRYFFYGTLLDADVQRIVIGRRIRRGDMHPATIDGFHRVYVAGAWYPTLVEATAEGVDGMVVGGLSSMERRRIHQFEDDAYVLRRTPVRQRGLGSVEAHVYLPPGPEYASDTPWSLGEWRRRYKRQYLLRSKRWMVSGFDQGW